MASETGCTFQWQEVSRGVGEWVLIETTCGRDECQLPQGMLPSEHPPTNNQAFGTLMVLKCNWKDDPTYQNITSGTLKSDKSEYRAPVSDTYEKVGFEKANVDRVKK